jgi:hypothetical protein
MPLIRNNMYGYHFTTIILGGLYYYGFVWGFYFAGSAVSPLFRYVQPEPGNIAASVAINMLVAFFGALIPAIIYAVAIERLLSPITKLFLLGTSLSYLIFSVWSVMDNFEGSDSILSMRYLYSDIGKMVSGIITLWFVSIIFLKIRSKTHDNIQNENPVETSS